MTNAYNNYPIFEGDQVLTATHLNSLRTFLENRSLSTRSRLIGTGIVCGLKIMAKTGNSITISEGLGLTSKGYLLELPESDCRYITAYRDKPVRDTGAKQPFEMPGYYPLFHEGEEEEQVPLWELLTNEEEALREDQDIHPLSINSNDELTIAAGGSESTVKLTEHVLVLYLELDDEDLESCFGEDCDEKGVRRSFNLRKLLVPESVIARASEAVPASGKLLCSKRPAFGGNENSYALTKTDSYEQLRRHYKTVIDKNAGDLEQELRNSWSVWASLLKTAFRTDPLEPLLGNTPLADRIRNAFSRSVYNIQQQFDCMKHLIQGWNEFLEAAEEASAYCLPDTEEFSRHLVLGPVEPSLEQLQRIMYRHEFRPASAADFSRQEVRDAVLKYRRLIEMLKHMRAPAVGDAAVKITPGADGRAPLAEHPIPFYFRLDGNSKLDKVWNPAHARRYRFDSYVTWRSRSSTANPCFRQPMDHNPDRHDFYRIEGHIGKPFEDVLQNLEGERQRLNLPVKVLGLKLSTHPANISLDNECKFDDLEQKYEMLTTGLSCLFEDEIRFFSNLQIQPHHPASDETNGDQDRNGDRNGDEEINGGDAGGTWTGGGMHTGGDIYSGTGSTAYYGGSTGTQYEIKKESAATSSRTFQDNKLAAGQTDDGAQFMMLKSGYTGEMDTARTGTVTSGDLIADQWKRHGTVSQVNLNRDYQTLFPDLSIPDLLILHPVRLADQIRIILDLLPEKLEKLDKERIKAAFEELTRRAANYREVLQARLDDLGGQKAMIIYRLDKLIDSCFLDRLLVLQEWYDDRVREYSKLRLLKKFAETHSGMEHQSGVPKGGTFVLVYVDENERDGRPGIPDFPRPIDPGLPDFPRPDDPTLPIEPPVVMSPLQEKPTLSDILQTRTDDPKKLLSGSLTRDDALTLTKDLKTITNTLKLDPSLTSQLSEKINRLEFDFQKRVDEMVRAPRPQPAPTRNVVVADFALPYLYKCECPEVSMVVISRITFALPKTEFCKKDTSRYEFVTDPAGGVVESETGGIVAEGKRYFFVPAQAESETEEIRFIYRLNNQEAVFNIRLYNPVADFEPRTGESEKKPETVNFINRSSGADRYEWDFGDGNTSTDPGPVHDYSDFEGETAVVTLMAHRAGCSDSISKRVDIPRPVKVEFSIESKEGFPERTYCNTDDRLYWFHTHPEDGTIEGEHTEGIISSDEVHAPALDPSKYEPGEYQFTYMGETLTVRVLEGPAGDFSYEVNEKSDTEFEVQFSYEGADADSVKWEVKSVRWEAGKIEPKEGTDVNFGLDKRDGLTYEVTVQVVGKKGCTTRLTHTLTFDVKPIEDEEPDSGDDESWDLQMERTVGAINNDFEESRNLKLDMLLFDGPNPVIGETLSIVDDLRQATGVPEKREQFRSGQWNDDLAPKFRSIFDNTAKVVFTQLKAGNELQANYATSLLMLVVSALIRLLSLQETDVNKTGGMGKLLTHMDSTLNNIKEMGVALDPDHYLQKVIHDVGGDLERAEKQPKLREAINKIDQPLRT